MALVLCQVPVAPTQENTPLSLKANFQALVQSMSLKVRFI